MVGVSSSTAECFADLGFRVLWSVKLGRWLQDNWARKELPVPSLKAWLSSAPDTYVNVENGAVSESDSIHRRMHSDPGLA